MIRCGSNCGAVIRMIPSNALIAARNLLMGILPTAACVVDATAGNGHDTLFLCENTPVNCQVWSFDIQQAAIDACGGLLARHGYAGKARLVLADHAALGDFIRTPVDAAMFNLGYLPGQDHALTTGPESLKKAMEKLLDLLAPGGIITVVAYPGHEPGKSEMDFLESFLAQLPQKTFTAAKFSFMNQKNFPAVLYSIGNTRRNPR